MPAAHGVPRKAENRGGSGQGRSGRLGACGEVTAPSAGRRNGHTLLCVPRCVGQLETRRPTREPWGDGHGHPPPWGQRGGTPKLPAPPRGSRQDKGSPRRESRCRYHEQTRGRRPEPTSVPDRHSARRRQAGWVLSLSPTGGGGRGGHIWGCPPTQLTAHLPETPPRPGSRGSAGAG